MLNFKKDTSCAWWLPAVPYPIPWIGCFDLSWTPLDVPSSRTLGNHLHLKLARQREAETLVTSILGVDGHHYLWPSQAAPWSTSRWPLPLHWELPVSDIQEYSQPFLPSCRGNCLLDNMGFLRFFWSSCLHPISGLLVQVNLDFLFSHSCCSFGIYSIRQGKKTTYMYIYECINIRVRAYI